MSQMDRHEKSTALYTEATLAVAEIEDRGKRIIQIASQMRSPARIKQYTDDIEREYRALDRLIGAIRRYKDN